MQIINFILCDRKNENLNMKCVLISLNLSTGNYIVILPSDKDH